MIRTRVEVAEIGRVAGNHGLVVSAGVEDHAGVDRVVSVSLSAQGAGGPGGRFIEGRDSDVRQRRLVANKKAFARLGEVGPVAAVSSLAKPAAAGDTVRGLNRSIAAFTAGGVNRARRPGRTAYIQYEGGVAVDPRCEDGGMALTADQQAEARAIAKELASIARSAKVLPGSLTSRRTHCGRPGCKCMADPPEPHGPYWQWTRKVAKRTVCRWLGEEQAADYRSWVANARRLHELVGRLEAMGVAAAEADPRSARPRGACKAGRRA